MIDPHLDREYTPSSMVDAIEPYLDAYRTRGEAARAALPHLTVSYGDRHDELIDVFPADDALLLHVFVHGGWWQQLSRHDGAYLAPTFVTQRSHLASVEYTLAPHAPLPMIVGQVCDALAFLHRTIRDRHGEPVPMIVSGHSAGAHLAAMAALRLPPSTICGLVLVSGAYDITPIIETQVNEAVGLDLPTAIAMSPLTHVLAGAGAAAVANHPIPTAVVVGEVETDAFKEQSARFSDAWRAAGHPTQHAVIDGRNHFDIIFDIPDRRSVVGGMVHAVEREILRP